MQYITVAEAKATPGLRLVLSTGVAAPWGESAKSILHVKNIPYVPVAQHLGQENADLVAWTGVRQAPIAIYTSERPRDRWLDILMLAERLRPEPALLPTKTADRAVVIGLANEICGEWGFGWCRRLMFMADGAPNSKIAAEYIVTPETIGAARPRLEDILTTLAQRLKKQHSTGSPYLFGESFTALDIYWACFAGYINPLPRMSIPTTSTHRAIGSMTTPWLEAVKDPILFEHRDFIYRKHLKLPLDF